MIDRCPRCDYSLAGLPEDYTCPECGFAYHLSSEVFRPRYPRGLAWYVVVADAIAIGLVTLFVPLPRWALALMAASMALSIAPVVLLVRRATSRCVLLSPQGIVILAGRPQPDILPWADISKVEWNLVRGSVDIHRRSAALRRIPSMDVGNVFTAERLASRARDWLNTRATGATSRPPPQARPLDEAGHD